MNKVIISGWFGHGNTGDEAIVSTMIKSIYKNVSETEIIIFSENPSHTHKYHCVPSIHRTSLRYMLNRLMAIKKTDLFLLGGGGFLHDASKITLISWLMPLLLSKLFSKKTMVYAVGINSFNSKFGKLLINSIFSVVDVITVRDELSKYRLQDAGIQSEKIVLTADPAHLIECSSEVCAKSILKYEGIDSSNKTIIGICIPPYFHKESSWPEKKYKYKKYKLAISQYIELVTNNLNTDVVFIPMQYPEDVDLAIEIKRMVKREKNVHVLSNPYSPEEISSIIKEVDIILGMRLHSLIISTVVGVPMVGIMYDDKVESYLQINGQKKYAIPHFIWDRTRFEDIDPEQLLYLTEEVLNNYYDIRKELKNVSIELSEKAKMNTEYIRQLLSKPM